MNHMSKDGHIKYRTSIITIVVGVLLMSGAVLADLLGISEPGIGTWQWLTLCLAAICFILGLAMLLATLPNR